MNWSTIERFITKFTDDWLLGYDISKDQIKQLVYNCLDYSDITVEGGEEYKVDLTQFEPIEDELEIELLNTPVGLMLTFNGLTEEQLELCKANYKVERDGL